MQRDELRVHRFTQKLQFPGVVIKKLDTRASIYWDGRARKYRLVFAYPVANVGTLLFSREPGTSINCEISLSFGFHFEINCHKTLSRFSDISVWQVHLAEELFRGSDTSTSPTRINASLNTRWSQLLPFSRVNYYRGPKAQLRENRTLNELTSLRLPLETFSPADNHRATQFRQFEPVWHDRARDGCEPIEESSGKL